MAKGMRCKNCKTWIPAGERECPQCQADVVDSMVSCGFDAKKERFHGSCELCGREGRKISKDGKDLYRCFDCYEKERATGFYQPNHGGRDWTPAYKALIEGYREYYHKPLFYGEQPNKTMIKHLEDMEVRERLSGVTIEREKNPNRKFVPSTSLSNIAKGISGKILISEVG